LRALLLERWPDLSHFFHVRPWELRLLSGPELMQYLEALDDIANQRRR
jgi:hypothetical protein